MTDDAPGPAHPRPWAAPGHERHLDAPPAPGPPTPSEPRDLAGPYATPDSRTAPPPAPSGRHHPFAVSDRHREDVLAGPGYSSPRLSNDAVAVTSLVLGLLGVVVPGLCLLAVATGHLGLHRLRRSYRGGRGLAVTGLVLGYLMTAVWLAILLLRAVANAVL